MFLGTEEEEEGEDEGGGETVGVSEARAQDGNRRTGKERGGVGFAGKQFIVFWTVSIICKFFRMAKSLAKCSPMLGESLP